MSISQLLSKEADLRCKRLLIQKVQKTSSNKITTARKILV